MILPRTSGLVTLTSTRAQLLDSSSPVYVHVLSDLVSVAVRY